MTEAAFMGDLFIFHPLIEPICTQERFPGFSDMYCTFLKCVFIIDFPYNEQIEILTVGCAQLTYI